MVRALLLLALCASTASAWPMPRPTAAQIVDAMQATYLALPAYHDDGTTFETDFVRDDAFLQFRSADTRVTSDDEDYVVSHHEMRARYPTLEEAARHAFVRSPTLVVVGALLTGEHNAYVEALRAAHIADEMFHGADCWRLDADALSFFVDKSSFLVVGVHQRNSGGSTTVIALDISMRVSTKRARKIVELVPPDGPPMIRWTEETQDYKRSRTWVGAVFDRSEPRITHVVPGTPAAAAGLQPGDRVVTVAGRPVDTSALIKRRFTRRSVGQDISMEIERGTTRLSRTLTLAAEPSVYDVQRTLLVGQRFAVPGIARPSGTPLVLLYTASWCAECRKLTVKAVHAKVIAITDELPDGAATLRKQLGIDVVIDGSHAIWDALLMQGHPTTIVVDAAGIVRHVGRGFDVAAVNAALGP